MSAKHCPRGGRILEAAAVRDAVFAAIIEDHVINDRPGSAQAAALAAAVDATPDLPLTQAERALLQESAALSRREQLTPAERG